MSPRWRYIGLVYRRHHLYPGLVKDVAVSTAVFHKTRLCACLPIPCVTDFVDLYLQHGGGYAL